MSRAGQIVMQNVRIDTVKSSRHSLNRCAGTWSSLGSGWYMLCVRVFLKDGCWWLVPL